MCRVPPGLYMSAVTMAVRVTLTADPSQEPPPLSAHLHIVAAGNVYAQQSLRLA
jgi:hypothetical protein